jgi:hypothetical protein
MTLKASKRLAQKHFFLNQGQQKKFGDAKIVCDEYENNSLVGAEKWCRH